MNALHYFISSIEDARNWYGGSGLLDWKWDFDFSPEEFIKYVYYNNDVPLSAILRSFIVLNGGNVNNYNLDHLDD